MCVFWNVCHLEFDCQIALAELWWCFHRFYLNCIHKIGYTVFIFERSTPRESILPKGLTLSFNSTRKHTFFTKYYTSVWISGSPQASLAHLTGLFSYMIQQRMRFVRSHRCGHQSQRATFQRLIAPIKSTRCCHDLSKHFLQDCRERRLSRSGVGAVKITKVSSGVFVCQKLSGTTRMGEKNN